MAYINRNGILYRKTGICAGCGREGQFSHTVRVSSKSRKPLAVYVCADCK